MKRKAKEREGKRRHYGILQTAEHFFLYFNIIIANHEICLCRKFSTL